MALINDLKFSKLGTAGHTGTVRDRELAWLQSIGATSNNINDAWREIAGSGTTTEMRWIPQGNAAVTRTLTYPTDWTPTTANWAIRVNMYGDNPTFFGTRFFVFAFASASSTINDGIFIGFNGVTNRYEIQVDDTYQSEFGAIRFFGDTTLNFQANIVLNSDGTIEFNGTPAPNADFNPLTFVAPNFIYGVWAVGCGPVFIDFIDKDDATNSRLYDFTVVSEMEPAAVPSFTDQNGANAVTISGTPASNFWIQRNLSVPGTGAGGEHINEIKRNYYLANGGSGNQFNDIELSFWQAF